jgi:hypothetical protein
MTDQTLVHFDSRGRGSLGAEVADGDYIVRREPGGVLVLEPAVVMSKAEAALLANAGLMAQIEENRQHPERRVGRPPRRTPRAAGDAGHV